ncbi:hypothetical protein Tco_0013680 [Tanacetum coccineum]
MANLFPPSFPLPPLRQPYTSSCGSMNLRNAREELHNVDMWNVSRISYGESWKARMQGGSVVEGLCGDFVASAHFRQQRGDVSHLVSKDSKEVLVSSLEVK